MNIFNGEIFVTEVDLIAPQINLGELDGGNYNDDDLITFTPNSSDTSATINCLLNNNSLACQINQQVNITDNQYLIQGENNLTITITDGSGNTDTTTTIFYVDTILPTLNIFSPTSNQIFTSQDVLINFSGNDTNLDSLWYFNGTDNVSYSSAVTLSLGAGSYEFIFYANDSFGNVGSLSRSFERSSTYNSLTGFCGGNGLTSTPYLICDNNSLANIDKNTSTLSSNFLVTENIDLNGSENNKWVPLSGTFSGIFDGGNKTISNLYIDGNYQYSGLFSKGDGATFKNFILEVDKVKTTYEGHTYGGSLVGTITNSIIEKIGININDGEIYCKESGSPWTSSICGGLSGSISNSNISNNFIIYNNSEVNSYSQWDDEPWNTAYSGGLSGYLHNSYIKKTYIVLDNNSKIYSQNSHEGFAVCSGGFSGITKSLTDISNSFLFIKNSKIKVNGDDGNDDGANGYAYSGGFFGCASHQTSNSYNINNLSISVNSDNSIEYVGGRSGRSNNRLFYGSGQNGCSTCEYYNLQTTPSLSTPTGTALTSQPDYKNENTFPLSNWDFENIWQINSSINNAYPSFKWQK